MSMQTSPPILAQFVRSTRAAIAYWHTCTQETDNDTVRQLDHKRQDLLQAVEIGLTVPQTQESTAVVLLQAFDLVERQGYWQEWIPMLEKAITVCAKKNISLEFELLNRLGQLQQISGQISSAIGIHKKAELAAQAMGDKQSLAIAYHSLSEDYLRHHAYTIAEEYGRAALAELNGAVGTERVQSFILNTLGKLERSRGNLAASEKVLRQAVALRRELGQSHLLLRTLSDLAITLQDAGKLDAALHYYKEAAALLTTNVDEIDKIMIQVNMGALYSAYEQWHDAEAVLRSINFNYLNQSNKIKYEATVSQGLGYVILKQGQAERAEPYFHRAITLWKTVGDKIEQANSMDSLGETLVDQKRMADALPLYKEALRHLENFPDNARAKKLQSEVQLKLDRLLRMGIK